MTNSSSSAKDSQVHSKIKKMNCHQFDVDTNSDDDSGLPIVVVDAPSGREGLWPKVRLAFLHIHKHFGEQYDWFMKADDDTFD